MVFKGYFSITFGVVNGWIAYSQWERAEGIKKFMQVVDFEEICKEKCTAVFKSISDQLQMCIFNCENFESLSFKSKLILIDNAQGQMYIASMLAIIAIAYGLNSLFSSKQKTE